MDRVDKEAKQVKYYDERINYVIDQADLITTEGDYCASEREDQVHFAS